MAEILLIRRKTNQYDWITWYSINWFQSIILIVQIKKYKWPRDRPFSADGAHAFYCSVSMLIPPILVLFCASSVFEKS